VRFQFPFRRCRDGPITRCKGATPCLVNIVDSDIGLWAGIRSEWSLDLWRGGSAVHACPGHRTLIDSSNVAGRKQVPIFIFLGLNSEMAHRLEIQIAKSYEEKEFVQLTLRSRECMREDLRQEKRIEMEAGMIDNCTTPEGYRIKHHGELIPSSYNAP
jgi:hypothetical protein